MFSVVSFLISFLIVALGQPARVGWLGALAAVCGYALFFHGIPPRFSPSIPGGIQELAARRRQSPGIEIGASPANSIAGAFTPPNRFLCGMMWFTGVQLVQLSWMTSIEFQGYYILFVYALLSLGMGAQFGILTWAVCHATVSRMPAIAALWTLMEWSRLFPMCGFSWNPVGLALTHCAFSLQFVSVFGIFGLTFWVLLTNLAGLHCLKNLSREFWKPAAVWIVLAAFPYIFGILQLHFQGKEKDQWTDAIDVAVVQTDLLPTEKSPHHGRLSEFVSPFVQWERILKSLKEGGAAKWDLIVFPEAFVPLQSDRMFYPYDAVKEILVRELGPETERCFPPLVYPYAGEHLTPGKRAWYVSNLFWCQTLSNHFGAEVVAGLDHIDQVNKKNFNSAFCLIPGVRALERYDKRVLLPLAEYLPMEFLRPLTESYGIADFFTQGESARVLGRKVRLSPSVCYEETFPEIMREGRVNGAHLFINVSNDNYYPASSLHAQHLSHARPRAVENGIPLIRSCNSGGSAVIDSFGNVENMEDGAHGILVRRLSTWGHSTLYTFFGDGAIVSLCLMICLWTWRSTALFG